MVLGLVTRLSIVRAATHAQLRVRCRVGGAFATVAGGCSFAHALQVAGPRAKCTPGELDAEQSGKKAAMKRWMQRKGVGVSDVPRVLTAFYVTKNLLFVVGLGVCIKFQPLRRFFKSGRPERLKHAFIARYPNFYSTVRGKILSGAEHLAASRFFRPLPVAFGTKPKAFALSLAENMVLFKLTFPVHAPITLLCIINYYAQPPAATERESVASNVSATTVDTGHGDSSFLGEVLNLEDVANTVDVQSNQTEVTS